MDSIQEGVNKLIKCILYSVLSLYSLADDTSTLKEKRNFEYKFANGDIYNGDWLSGKVRYLSLFFNIPDAWKRKVYLCFRKNL